MPSRLPDSFLMADLTPKKTGLPFVVWVSQNGDSGHDVRVVSAGAKAIPSEMVAVAIRPAVRVVDGELSASDSALLKRWVGLNMAVLVKYWYGDIEFTEDAIKAIRPIRM